METTFDSSPRRLAFSQEQVYALLSDLNNIERVRTGLPDDKVSNLTIDGNSITMTMAPVGNITLSVVDREPCNTIRFATTQSPLPFTLCVQLRSLANVGADSDCVRWADSDCARDAECEMVLSVTADLNPFVRGLVAAPLHDALEKIADTLSQINYQQQ